MKQPVHVTVQMATVGTPVEVSASCVILVHYFSWDMILFFVVLVLQCRNNLSLL